MVLYDVPTMAKVCYKFVKLDKEKFGIIKDITDKEYYTNSCVKLPNSSKKIETEQEAIKFIYDNMQYAEFNNIYSC